MRTLLPLLLALSLTLFSPFHATAQEGPSPDDEEYETADPDATADDSQEPEDPSDTLPTVAPEKTQDIPKAKPPKKGVTILPKGPAPEPTTQNAEDFTVLGTGPVRKDITPLRIALGYPEMEVIYHIPLSDDFEIGLGGGLFYGFNASTAGDIFGPKGVLEAKWRIWRDQAHSLALTAAPSAYIQMHPDAAFGLQIGAPGLTYEYTIENKHHAILGIAFPWGVFFQDSETFLRVPMVFKMGLEFALNDSFHLFFTTETGADIWNGDGANAYFFVRTLGGVAIPL